MSKCVAANIMKGTSKTTMNPNVLVSPKEVYIMLERGLGLGVELERNTKTIVEGQN